MAGKILPVHRMQSTISVLRTCVTPPGTNFTFSAEELELSDEDGPYDNRGDRIQWSKPDY